MVSETSQVAAYVLVDVILLALIRADWRSHHRPRVYPAMLAVFAAAQLPTFFVFKLPAWRAFTEWFAALPLP